MIRKVYAAYNFNCLCSVLCQVSPLYWRHTNPWPLFSAWRICRLSACTGDLLSSWRRLHISSYRWTHPKLNLSGSVRWIFNLAKIPTQYRSIIIWSLQLVAFTPTTFDDVICDPYQSDPPLFVQQNPVRQPRILSLCVDWTSGTVYLLIVTPLFNEHLSPIL